MEPIAVFGKWTDDQGLILVACYTIAEIRDFLALADEGKIELNAEERSAVESYLTNNDN